MRHPIDVLTLKPGDRVVYCHPLAGYTYDMGKAQRLLVLDAIYTVRDVHVDSTRTTFLLDDPGGYGDVWFNSVNFDLWKEEEPMDVTSEGLAVLTDEERALVVEGKRIQAIKSVRDRTGLGLKESKDAVDAIHIVGEKASQMRIQFLEDQVANLNQRAINLRAQRDRYEAECLDLRHTLDKNKGQNAENADAVVGHSIRTQAVQDFLNEKARTLTDLLPKVYGKIGFEDFEVFSQLETDLRTGVRNIAW